MSLDASSGQPQLGPWRATYGVDPAVRRYLDQCQPWLIFAGFLFVAAVGVPMITLTPASLFLFLLPLAVLIGVSCTRPAGKSGAFFWMAVLRRGWQVDVFADGFILSDGLRSRRSWRWDDVRRLRHPLFDSGKTWMRDGDQPCFTQKAPRLVLELADRRTIEFSDVLASVEALNETIQREVYPRLLEQARRQMAAGGCVSFEPFQLRTEGLHFGSGFLTWAEIDSLQLHEGGLHLRRRGGWRTEVKTAPAASMPNVSVLLALLEELQPDLACDLLQGLPLDSAARLWQRTAGLRLLPPSPAQEKSPTAADPSDQYAEEASAPKEAASAETLDDVPDHTGRPNRSTADFFVPPPPEIGPLVSAASTLQVTDQPMGLAERIHRVLAMVLVLSAGGLGIGLWLGMMRGGVVYAIVCPIAGLVAAGVVWIRTRFEHACTYVGTLGAARYRCHGSRDNLIERSVFLFRDAVALHSKVTRYYQNKHLQRSEYDYDWLLSGGSPAFQVSVPNRGWERADIGGATIRILLHGQVDCTALVPPPNDLSHFGAAAEVAWSLHRLDAVQTELERDGCVRFTLATGGVLRLGPGFIDFGKGPQDFTVADLALIDVKQEKAPGSTSTCNCCGPRAEFIHLPRGSNQISLSDIADVQLFLFLLRTLVVFGSAQVGQGLVSVPSAGDHWMGSPWHQDARATAFVCKSLRPDAAERALQHLRTGGKEG
jgi:hypothetical protein